MADDYSQRNFYVSCQAIQAINENNLEYISMIVEGGYDIDQDWGLTLLCNAASKGQLDIVKYLVSARANINYQAEDEWDTALMLAASHGYLDVVKFLVEMGADVNLRDIFNDNALMMAAPNAHEDVFNYLYPLTIPEWDVGRRVLEEAKRDKQKRRTDLPPYAMEKP